MRLRYEDLRRSYNADVVTSEHCTSHIRLHVSRRLVEPELILDLVRLKNSTHFSLRAAGAAIAIVVALPQVFDVFRQNPYLSQPELELHLQRHGFRDSTETERPLRAIEMEQLEGLLHDLCADFMVEKTEDLVNRIGVTASRLQRLNSTLK